MKVLICGSRGLVDEKYVRNAVLMSGFIPTLIISGGARGIDHAAIYYAMKNSIPYEVYPADWDKYGKSAGFRRNIEMLEKCEAVIAIWDGESRGTAHTIKEAQKRGLPLYVYNWKEKRQQLFH